MFNYIERLRRKPRDARMRIAFLFAVAVTAVIVFVWMFSLPSRLSTLGNSEQSDFSAFSETASSVRDTVRGAEVFGDNQPAGAQNAGAVQNAIDGDTTTRQATSSRPVLIATSTAETTAQ